MTFFTSRLHTSLGFQPFIKFVYLIYLFRLSSPMFPSHALLTDCYGVAEAPVQQSQRHSSGGTKPL